MSERKVGEFVRQHKKAELAIGLGGAAVGFSAFMLGRRALAHRHQQQRLRGELPEVDDDPVRYRQLLTSFEAVAAGDEVLRRSIYAVAAQIYTDIKYTNLAVVTGEDMYRNARVDATRMADIHRQLGAFVGTSEEPNLLGKRENPKRLAGEGAPQGYYPMMLSFTDGGVEKEFAPSYYDEVVLRLDWLDAIGGR